MIDPNRAELLEVIRRISAVYPDFRLGQLICNLTMEGRGPEFGDIWEVEDEQLIPVAKDLLAALEARAAHTSAAG
jgi:hypothetical protein